MSTISSSYQSVPHGVPQGSVIGPLLFAIFVNDLVLVLKKSEIDMYADDTTMYLPGKSVDVVQAGLQEDMDVVIDWCNKNKTAIHTGKSKCLLACTVQKRAHLQKKDMQMRAYGKMLTNVSSLEILGVHIDSDMSWKSHIKHVCVKGARLNGLLWRMSPYLDTDIKLLFYNSMLLSRIDYCISIWGAASKKYMNRLYIMQKRAIRTVFGINRDESVSHILRSFKIMTVYQRFYYKNCVNMYNIMQCYAPNYLSDIFEISNPSHTYNLRSHAQLKVPKPKTELFKASLTV